MKLTLKRIALRNTYTIGKLFIDDEYFCDTLEDKVRDLGKNGEGKVYGETAIPYGEYEIKVTYSPKFKRMLPLLLNVPYFIGIRIHRGNTAKDSDGCILVGKNTQVGKVLNSTPYEKEIVEILTQAQNAGKTITINII